MTNDVETRRWNDERWTSVWPQREVLTGSISSYLLTQVAAQSGEQVLDVGCGGGGVAIALGESVRPDGRVVGVDLSIALLDLARARAADAGQTNVVFQHVDAQIDRMDGAPFDVAVSQFGVMFFDEPVTAFANIRSHLRPAGRLIFAAWQPVERNPWHIGTALRSVVSPPSPPAPGKSGTGPFTLGDTVLTTSILVEAGFASISHRHHEITVQAPASAIVDGSLLEFMGVPPERMKEAEQIIEDHLRQFKVGDDVYQYPLAFNIFAAANPS